MSYLKYLYDSVATLPPVVLAILGVWLLGMVLLPILRWTVGEKAIPGGISVTVLLQTAAAVAVLGTAWGPVSVGAAVLLVPLCGWLVEFLGSKTGFPFGDYSYTKALQPQIGDVPVIIPIAWLMMAPAAWAVADAILPDGHLVLRAIIAGAAFTAWDLYLDPQMVGWGFWRWHKKGRYFGIPLVNFFGWFLAAGVMSLVVGVTVGGLAVPTGPLLVMYVLTWLLQGFAQAVFWRMPATAAFGFVGMGVFAVVALLRAV